MKISKKQLKALVMTAAIALPIAASSITGIQSVSAAPAEAADVTIRINKFGINKNQPMGTPNLDLNNMTHAEAVAALAAAQYSALKDVSFKLYRLDSDTLASVKADKFMGYVSETEATALAATAEEVGLDGATDANGQTSTTVKVPNNGAYMIVETSAPASVVQKSDAQVVQLPVYRVNADEQHEVVNGTLDLYMKNRTNTGSLQVDKDIEDNTEAKNLQATFQLTKIKSQSGATVTEDFGSRTTNGLVDGVDFGWDNLTYGTYKLVETSTAGDNYQKIAEREFVINDENLAQVYMNDSKIMNPLRPSIEKTVDMATEGKPGADTAGLVAAGVAVGSTFDWHLNTDIPANITDMTEFYVSDTMPAQISFNAGATEVYISDEKITDGSFEGATKLVEDEDYSVEQTGQKVVFDFNEDAREKMGENTDGYVYIKYNTTLNTTEDLEVNSFILENEGRVDWTVGNAPESGNDTDTSETWTGAKKFQKTDGTNALAGAEFMVKNADGEYLSYNDKQPVWVESAEDGEVFKSTTENDATFLVDGLAAGTYTLIETKTPVNFATMSDHEFEITKTDAAANGDADELYTNEVVNLPANKLPLTGGMGYIAAALGGLAAMFMAVRGYRRIK